MRAVVSDVTRCSQCLQVRHDVRARIGADFMSCAGTNAKYGGGNNPYEQTWKMEEYQKIETS